MGLVRGRFATTYVGFASVSCPLTKQKSPEWFRGFFVGDRPHSFRYPCQPPVMVRFSHLSN